jgi:hypothetical protein
MELNEEPSNWNPHISKLTLIPYLLGLSDLTYSLQLSRHLLAMEPDSEETIQLKIIDERKLEKVSSLHDFFFTSMLSPKGTGSLAILYNQILLYVRNYTVPKIRFMYFQKWNCSVLFPIPTFRNKFFIEQSASLSASHHYAST